MKPMDRMEHLTAGTLLELWRKCRERVQDPLERTLLCNATILKESCRWKGQAVYQDEMEVLRDLTPREMERLLGQLAEGETEIEPSNPAFDPEQFAAMRGE